MHVCDYKYSIVMCVSDPLLSQNIQVGSDKVTWRSENILRSACWQAKRSWTLGRPCTHGGSNTQVSATWRPKMEVQGTRFLQLQWNARSSFKATCSCTHVHARTGVDTIAACMLGANWSGLPRTSVSLHVHVSAAAVITGYASSMHDWSKFSAAPVQRCSALRSPQCQVAGCMGCLATL